MKYILATILTIGILAGPCLGQETAQLNDQKDKESYSLGYQFGQSLKAQGLDINMDVYASGIRDALRGAKPLLSQEEINKAVSEVQARGLAGRQKEMKGMAEKNLSEGKAFMEANKKKEGVITLPSGLEYKVLREGTGRTPRSIDQVTINYIGSFIGGTEFDNTYKRGAPLTIKVDQIIPGWKEALLSMKEGSKWLLFIPPELAYGDRAVGPIPPNSTLVLEVEMISIK
jgi:FKBP-type peptidyl-prolyl cis-trans isomerase FklB